MDLKNVAAHLIPSSIKFSGETRAIKTTSTTEREGNGQQFYQGQGQEQNESPLSDEELKKVMEHLRSLKFVKESGLQVQLVVSNEKRFVVIQEIGGKLIRRIPELELRSLVATTDKDRGQLLNSKV
mgnify:CR=1 FL=1